MTKLLPHSTELQAVLPGRLASVVEVERSQTPDRESSIVPSAVSVNPLPALARLGIAQRRFKIVAVQNASLDSPRRESEAD